MERLQAAVEKARLERESRAASTAEPAAPNQQPDPIVDAARVLAKQSKETADPDPETADDARETHNWDDFTEVELSVSAARRRRIFLNPRSEQATYFDKLRTKVLQICRDNGWKRIAVTSGSKGCGKTTICSNLAASFTRQQDRRTILFDMDMRRPGLGAQFGYKSALGLSDVLEGHTTFESVAFRFGHNVLIAPNHAPHFNPAKLLLQDRTPEILAEIEDKYQPDFCIFDTPPMLAADDTLALLKHVDCTIIVAAAEKTTTQEVDEIEKEISEQTNVLGVVLNRCIYMDNREAYYYR